MKHPKLFLSGTFIAAIAIAMLLFANREPRSIEPAAVVADTAAVAEQPQAVARKPRVSRPAPAAPAVHSNLTSAEPKVAGEPPRRVQARANQVLATVNNQQIQLKDLLAVVSEDAETTMTTEEYQSRLNRAIEVELTFQAAQAQGLVLTAEQRRRLVQIGQNHKARLADYKQQGISWSSVTTPQLEFERRLMSALMLQQNLVAKEAAVAPSPNVIVQTRYEQALRDILARLKASANISVANAVL
jgi:hypothetical protein